MASQSSQPTLKVVWAHFEEGIARFSFIFALSFFLLILSIELHVVLLASYLKIGTLLSYAILPLAL